jgi:FkbM family methyltransferase
VNDDADETRFHVNYDPFTSSAFELNPYFRDYCATMSGVDYLLGEAVVPVREISVVSHSLDRLCMAEGAPLEPPDILTLDTQGSEFDILQGATDLLDRHVVAIVAEVQFNEVYQGTALFGEISSYLRNKGFLFADFSDIARYAPLRGPIGARSEGLCLFADALFLRDPHRIAASWGRRADRALRKLAFLALCHQQLEFAQLCLRLCVDRAEPADRTYLRLLDEFSTACASLPEGRPWTYPEAYSPEASRALTEPVSDAESHRIRIEMAGKAARESQKLNRLPADTGAVVDLLERHGFSFAPRLRRFQERVVGAYRDAITHWSSIPLTPSNDPGEAPR